MIFRWFLTRNLSFATLIQGKRGFVLMNRLFRFLCSYFTKLMNDLENSAVTKAPAKVPKKNEVTGTSVADPHESVSSVVKSSETPPPVVIPDATAGLITSVGGDDEIEAIPLPGGENVIQLSPVPTVSYCSFTSENPSVLFREHQGQIIQNAKVYSTAGQLPRLHRRP